MVKLCRYIDSFVKLDDGSFFAEYDGWHFEAKSEKALFNKILRYIWKEQNED